MAVVEMEGEEVGKGGGGTTAGEGGGVEMVTNVELEMHRKWNVSFKSQEEKESGGETNERQQKYLAKREEEEIRRITQEAARKREERQREERERQRMREREASTSGAHEEVDERTKYILELLQEAKTTVPEKVRTGYTAELVILNFVYSEHNRMTVKVAFPAGFSPTNRLVHFDVGSNSLHEDIVTKLHKGLEQDLNGAFGSEGKVEENSKGNPISHVYNFCDRFLGKNQLLTAYDEIQSIKKEFLQEPSKLIGLENKAGNIKVHIQVDKYYIDMKVSCKDYPDGSVELSLLGSNLPEYLKQSFVALTLARIRSQGDDLLAGLPDELPDEDRPPEKKVVSKMKKKINPRRMKFQTAASAATERALQYQQEEKERLRIQKLKEEASKPKVREPRIYAVVSYMYKDLLKEVAESKCPACKKKVLPSDPELCGKVGKKMRADRLYCGHFYHHHCLTTYLSKPPFDDTCHTCGAQIMHHKFNDTKQALEKRWAQKEARQQEENDFNEMFGM